MCASSVSYYSSSSCFTQNLPLNVSIVKKYLRLRLLVTTQSNFIVVNVIFMLLQFVLNQSVALLQSKYLMKKYNIFPRKGMMTSTVSHDSL